MDTFTAVTTLIDQTAITVVTDVASVDTSPALQAQIERGWSALLSYRDITVNDTLLRVVDASESAVRVVADITYQSVVGVRYCTAIADIPYQALSAMVLTCTSDNYLVLFTRDSGDWPHSYECLGGFVRARYTCTSVEVFTEARFAAEAGQLTVKSAQKLGDYHLLSIAEYMCVYRFNVTESAAEVCASYPTAHLVSLSQVSQILADSSILDLPLHHPTTLVLRELVRQGVLG